MSPTYLITLSFCLVELHLLVGLVQGADAPSSTVQSSCTPSPLAPSSIGLSSAIEIEASVSAEVAHSASSSSQSMAYYPTDIIAGIPEYAWIKEMVSVLPPIQA